jgi:phage terminase large subunit GpA-like protein
MCTAQAVRSMRQFAEDEIVLPSGPREGLRFRCDFMPWTALVLAEFDRGHYQEFWGSGPGQGGKTLLFFVIPLLYHLFEIGEDVILGCPIKEMAQAIYEKRALPTIRRSRYASLIPTTGPGSRGGQVKDQIEFANGASLRFMGARGSISSYTARVVLISEVDQMDVPGPGSREADPVSRIIARTASYGRRRRIYAECTMSTAEGRIHKEVCEYGSDTRVMVPCPHCGVYLWPEREQFAGWQTATDIHQAMAEARYICQGCGVPWTEEDRGRALEKPVLVAKGQTVDKAGVVSGDEPRTTAFGFRWNAMLSSLTPMSELATYEYRASQSESPNDMKVLMQYRWVIPYDEEGEVHLSQVTQSRVMQCVGKLPRGMVPQGTRLTVGIDPGLYRCYWAAWAWAADTTGYLVDYGAIEVPQARETSTVAILTSLREFRDAVLRPGWQTVDSPDLVHPRLALIDAGGQFRDIVYQFVRESGVGYLPSKGCGTTRGESPWIEPRMHVSKAVIQGHEWRGVAQPEGVRLMEMHSDHWKREIHAAFQAAHDQPGALHLFAVAEARDHYGFARHIVAEREMEIYEPGKGRRTYWESVHRANHWLDCSYACRCAADIVGIKALQRVIDDKPIESPRPVVRDPTRPRRVRTPGARPRTWLGG